MDMREKGTKEVRKKNEGKVRCNKSVEKKRDRLKRWNRGDHVIK